MLQIKNRYSGAVILEIDALTLSGANLSDAYLRGADLRDANLRGADLSYANLIDADLRGAYLSGADLRYAYLSGANLSGANLRGADLGDANLRGINLRYANLRGANLIDADLSGANLSDANLRGADLIRANLSDAYLRGADLRGADLEGVVLDAVGLRKFVDSRTIVAEGDIFGYKKVSDGGIVKLRIPAAARRVGGAVGRKCRAEYAEVIEGSGHSKTDLGPRTEYRPGETVRPDKFDDNPLVECAGGIHFFITRTEAENY